MASRVFGGSIPEPVLWDQKAILSAIAAISSGLTQLTNVTGNPGEDARATAVREVTAERMIATLDNIYEQIMITNMHLAVMTEQHFSIGDDFNGT